MHSPSRLVADIGGTNARFSIWQDGQLSATSTLCTADFASLEEAIEHYLQGVSVQPGYGCLAIAGPTDRKVFQLTNSHWRFSAATVRERFGWRALRVINDFEALAFALPALADQDSLPIGGGETNAALPSVVVGPGTGFGVALSIPEGTRSISIATEGGHAGLAPGNPLELDIFRYWMDKGLPLCRESFLSGIGIYRIYDALCALSDVPVQADSGEAVSALATAADPTAAQAIDIFCALLGSACGDQALACGSRGGVFLAGGILPKIQQRLLNSEFRARFEAKGAMRDYVAAISTRLITIDNPGLIGAAHCPMDD